MILRKFAWLILDFYTQDIINVATIKDQIISHFIVQIYSAFFESETNINKGRGTQGAYYNAVNLEKVPYLKSETSRSHDNFQKVKGLSMGRIP